MLLLVSGATTTVRRINDPRVGVLVVPRARNNPMSLGLRPGKWGMDNGAFGAFDAASFVRMLDTFQACETCAGCVFVAAPDVVGNARATRDLFEQWAPRIRGRGFPVALVAQDGLTVPLTPWKHIDALFIGGTTTFKLGLEARTLAAYAKARGKWVHMGRVNGSVRTRYAYALGCDSVDGSSFSRWPAIRIPLWQGWMNTLQSSHRSIPPLETRSA